MKDSKKGVSFIEKRNDTAEKRSYKKPQLGRVTLFADQVLGVCREPVMASACVLKDVNMS